MKRAKYIYGLIGSKDKLIEEINNANNNEKYQWAAELSDIGLFNFPDDEEIKKLYSTSLENLSLIEKNPIARNYYLSEAYELSEKISPSLKYTVSAEQVKNIPLSTFFDAMGPRLDPIKAKNKFIKVGFNITDSGEKFGIVIRNQIAEISNFYNEDYDVIVSVDSQTWKGIILRTESAARAIASGKLSIDGESLKFLQFSSLFVND